MDTIKDRNGNDLIEAEEIKKRWKECSEELHTKGLNSHHGVTTHLEPDIPECEIERALGGVAASKASGGGRSPAKLFQILKDDSIKVRTQHVSKFGKLSSGHRTGKGQS